jgi:hypothetical protein
MIFFQGFSQVSASLAPSRIRAAPNVRASRLTLECAEAIHLNVECRRRESQKPFMHSKEDSHLRLSRCFPRLPRDQFSYFGFEDRFDRRVVKTTVPAGQRDTQRILASYIRPFRSRSLSPLSQNMLQKSGIKSRQVKSRR